MELTVVKPDEILLYSDYEFEYNTQTYTMKSLYKVSVLTTDEGPFVDDVALALFFTDIIIAIPSEHPDYQNTYDQLSKTLKFNYEEYIKAMSCSDNAEFVLWEKYDNSEDMIFCPLVDKDVSSVFDYVSKNLKHKRETPAMLLLNESGYAAV